MTMVHNVEINAFYFNFYKQNYWFSQEILLLFGIYNLLGPIRIILVIEWNGYFVLLILLRLKEFIMIKKTCVQNLNLSYSWI